MNIKKVIINFILNVFGYAYIWIEQYKDYPNDNNILGMKIDKDLHGMSRKQLQEITGRWEVPAIVIDGKNIGGLDNLIKII